MSLTFPLPSIIISMLSQTDVNQITGCGSVWLERHLREVEAAGSNPVTPTKFLSNTQELFCFRKLLNVRRQLTAGNYLLYYKEQ